MGFAPIENQHLSTAHTLKGFADDWQLAKAAKFTNTRIIERARAGNPISLRNIHRLAAALGIANEIWKLKPTFGGDFDAEAFKRFVPHESHIDRSFDDLAQLTKLAAFVSELQAKAATAQQLIIELLKRHNSVILTFKLSKEDSFRLYTAFIDGALVNCQLTSVTIYPTTDPLITPSPRIIPQTPQVDPDPSALTTPIEAPPLPDDTGFTLPRSQPIPQRLLYILITSILDQLTSGKVLAQVPDEDSLSNLKSSLADLPASDRQLIESFIEKLPTDTIEDILNDLQQIGYDLLHRTLRAIIVATTSFSHDPAHSDP